MKKLLLGLPILLFISCGGGGGGGNTTPPPAVVRITISPTSASVNAGGTQQFTATVTGSTNTAVT
jgi:chitinase